MRYSFTNKTTCIHVHVHGVGVVKFSGKSPNAPIKFIVLHAINCTLKYINTFLLHSEESHLKFEHVHESFSYRF